MASAMCTVEKTSSGREYKVKDINEADFGTPRPAARATPHKRTPYARAPI